MLSSNGWTGRSIELRITPSLQQKIFGNFVLEVLFPAFEELKIWNFECLQSRDTWPSVAPLGYMKLTKTQKLGENKNENGNRNKNENENNSENENENEKTIAKLKM